MHDVIWWLDHLNRKERFFLVGHALGNHGFQLSLDFRREIEAIAGAIVPENAFSWMDYHMDWVHVALVLAAQDARGEPIVATDVHQSPNFATPGSTKSVYVNANQEDIDLLVAFKSPDGVRLVFLEAKGTTEFTTKQLDSKMARLRAIFEHRSSEAVAVLPSFALVSPSRPNQPVKEWYPRWAAPGGEFPWLPLPMASNRVEVTRPSTGASTWHVRRDIASSGL